MFWIFYLFSLRFKFIKIYFISIFCLTLLEFYFNTFYFNLFNFLGVLGILESIVFNYVALCFFVLDVMLYLSRRKYDQRSYYRLNSLQRNAIYPTYHSEHFIAYTQQSKCGKNLVYLLMLRHRQILGVDGCYSRTNIYSDTNSHLVPEGTSVQCEEIK